MSANITIVDGVMGAGKTTYMIAEMNKHPMQRYLYVTPFLDEVERIKQACSDRNFKEPIAISGSKTKGLKQLVEKGVNIATTHSLFVRFDNELLNLLEGQGYTLVLDEALEITRIEPVSDAGRKMLTKANGVLIDKDTSLATWDSVEFPSAKGNEEFERIKAMCDNESLYWLLKDRSKGDGFIAWHLPPKAFSCFKNVFILTYQFQGSLMDSYMQLHGLEYSIDKRFAALDQKSRTKFKELIEFIEVDSRWTKELRDKDLSKNWVMNKMDAKQVKASIKTICDRLDFELSDVMWTIFKGAAVRIPDSRNKLRGPYGDNASQAKKSKSNFVPCNARATNQYGDREILFYLCNRFPNLEVEKYFQQRGFPVDRDKFALNEMLQWIFRSRIRNDEPIKLFLPSPRMRRLLEDWLDGKDLEANETTGLAA